MRHDVALLKKTKVNDVFSFENLLEEMDYVAFPKSKRMTIERVEKWLNDHHL